MQKLPPGSRAFSLVELLAVICITLVMAGMVVPAMSGLTRANELNNASRLVSNMLSVARTEAVTKRTKTRFAVVRDWQGKPEANFRKMSIWKQDLDKNAWVQITRWEEIPVGVKFDTNSSSYAPAAIADHLLSDSGSNSFTAVVNGQNVDLQYAEFFPNGGAFMPNMTGFDIWLALTPATPVASGNPVNWAKITASTLTGRLKIDRP